MGERAFHAVLVGYQFLIAEESVEEADPPTGTAS
jgi:hypothetical protein